MNMHSNTLSVPTCRPYRTTDLGWFNILLEYQPKCFHATFSWNNQIGAKVNRIFYSICSDKELALETQAFESLYGGQFTLSTQLIRPNFPVILPPTQHHSFFRNLPLYSFIMYCLEIILQVFSINKDKQLKVTTMLGQLDPRTTRWMWWL